MTTHETFVQAVAQLACATLSFEERQACESVKLVYGSGPSGTRGVTFYHRWKRGNDAPVPFVEIAAFGQENWVQVAGTTLHELGHVLAGWNAAHGKDWKAACERLGLRRIHAAGTRYCLAMFKPALRDALAALPKPSEGEPVNPIVRGGALIGFGPATPIKVKGCNVGLGTRGGKGTRSGSAMRLFLCECEPPVRARVVSDTFEAHCDLCAAAFKRALKRT